MTDTFKVRVAVFKNKAASTNASLAAASAFVAMDEGYPYMSPHQTSAYSYVKSKCYAIVDAMHAYLELGILTDIISANDPALRAHLNSKYEVSTIVSYIQRAIAEYGFEHNEAMVSIEFGNFAFVPQARNFFNASQVSLATVERNARREMYLQLKKEFENE